MHSTNSVNHVAQTDRVRVLYSFPHKIGASRICYTAWQQVNGLAAAGADLLVCPGAVQRSLPVGVRVQPTLAWQQLRIPYRLLGSMRAFTLHDRIVAARLRKYADQVDIVHAWPLGSLQTLRTAAQLGIPAVLERPNAHTRFAYEVVAKECSRIGVALPPDHEHAFKADVLAREEEEYQLASRLLCPSAFTAGTFLDRGFAATQLARHIYGYDEKAYYPDPLRTRKAGLTMLFVGVCAVRKGLHFALDAWLRSPASQHGTFLIAGEFLPAYRDSLSAQLAHPSVHVLGHRGDVPELMRESDILVLPSIEEGFGLVCTEAMGSGAVPLVSEACTDLCRHMENSLVHAVGNVDALARHITLVHENRQLLDELRTACLQMAPKVTWTAAGRILLEVYRDVLASSPRRKSHIEVNALPSSSSRMPISLPLALASKWALARQIQS